MTNTYYDTYANSKGSHRNIILQPAEDMVSNFGGLRGRSDLQMFSKVKSDLRFDISNFDAVSMPLRSLLTLEFNLVSSISHVLVYLIILFLKI